MSALFKTINPPTQVPRQGFMDAAIAAAVVLELMETLPCSEFSTSGAHLQGCITGALDAQLLRRKSRRVKSR